MRCVLARARPSSASPLGPANLYENAGARTCSTPVAARATDATDAAASLNIFLSEKMMLRAR
jgi:hypothetical protein